jgi:ABC-type oligopeptide transport system substrate-binding subunit
MGHTIPWLPLDTAARPSVNFFLFNLSRQPFSNVLVREAFAAATDRTAVVSVAQSQGVPNATPATTVTPAQTLGRDLFNEVGIPFNPARARQALDDAGYSDRSTFPPITLLTSRGATPEATFNAAIAEKLAEMWRLYLGVDVTVEVVESKYFNRLTNDPGDVFSWGWGADYNDPDDFLQLVFHSDSENNISHISLDTFDDVVDRAAAIQDPAERQALYIEAERLLTEEAIALIPLFHSTLNLP